MRELIQELLPHAPQMGLYVVPQIPEDKLRNALRDYAPAVAPEAVCALYDATLMGSAKDGALFTAERLLFQNNDLEPVHEVRYEDIVRVETRRKLIGGQKVLLDVNRGRATFNLSIDFSGKADAAPYVARLLNEVMLRGAAREMDRVPLAADRTDWEAVEHALGELRREGLLTDDDYERLLRVRTRG